MANTIVVKPSQRMVEFGEDSFETIISDGHARGFLGAVRKVDNFDNIVVVGEGKTPQIARIKRVTDASTLSENGHKIARIDVCFENPTNLTPQQQKIVNEISWQGQRNVRYIAL